MKKILSIILVLILGVSFAACSGSPSNDSVTSTATVSIVDVGGNVYTVDMETLTEIGIVEFETVQGKSGVDPESNIHSGVSLKTVFEHVGINTEGITQIQCTSTDGFSSVYSKAALDDSEKLFLTYVMDGETLKSGDTDTFYIIARNEEFKQNWTKYLMDIQIQR